MKLHCVLTLLEAGANPRIKNVRGKTFQSYLRMRPLDSWNKKAQREMRAIDEWLRAHGVPVEAG